MTVHFVVVFLVDCTLVEMCFKEIIAKQWVSLWFEYLQPITFNVKDNSQAAIRQMALACQAPLSRYLHSDPMAGGPPLSSARWCLVFPSQAISLPSSVPSLASVLVHFYVILFQSRWQRWGRRTLNSTQKSGQIKSYSYAVGKKNAGFRIRSATYLT